ncbi:GM24685 [Drosophila sechellia]|uniref:Gamma-tubulin complex component n=1 Tax=Drosophila sechellia TaxID=7238 RepID=B4HFH4_DROSE|nr:GM24685 [Drosophila sechellia]
MRLERPLTRAMRETIMDYLSTTRHFLLSLQADSLFQLLNNSSTAMQLLCQLDRMFENEPRLNLNTGITGSFLLSSIWLAIDTCENKDFLQLLIYFLRCISRNYFIQLQRWIYHGELDEPVNEIFISRSLNTSPSFTNECSKEFFDKSYQVVNEAIPEFLVGCEEQILQCGKYNLILQAYNARHPVFEVLYPDIEVCLTEQQLKNMRRNLADKYAIIYKRFGWCSMQSIFEDRMAAKRVFANLMMKRTQAHLDAWAEKQRELQIKANAQKKLQNDLLNAEQERIQKNHLEKRRQDIVNELAFQRECERMEDKRLEREKQELQKEVVQLAGVLPSSPDRSTVSDLSFASCIEEPDCLAESPSDKDNANTDNSEEEATKQVDATLYVPLEHPGAEGTQNQSNVDRNRKRNEHHDGFVSFNSSEDQHTHRLRSLLNSNTERGRNRLRVMETEFGLGYKNTEMEKKATPCLPLELDKLHVEIPLSVPTPMSTTSDVDFGDPSPRETPEIADTVNNNNVSAISGSLSPELPKPVLAIAKPTSLLPKVDFGMEEEKETEQDRDPLPEACNPFMARRCLQLSVMAPVNAYYVLLRNEVLRIFQEQRIYEHFRKLRNYFFLVDGQFGATLTNEILGRIKAGVGPRSLSQKGILDTMLTNALAACSADETTVSENLTLNCTTIPDTLNFLSVEATSMIKLNCKIDWPLNMVISSETISKYGQIFGYLLKLRHVSFVLDGTYEYLQQMAKLLGPELRTCAHFRHMQMMRHKLSHFMTSFQTHLVAKALLSTWKSFKEELCAANSIEALYKQHVAYLKRVAFLALLNRRSAKVKETIDNILVIILRFCKVIQSQSFIVDQDNYFVHPRFKRLQQEEAEFEKFVQYLIYLGNKAAASGYQEEIGDLICIINFNHYYKVSGNHTGSSMEDKKC